LEKKKFTSMGVKEKSTMADKKHETGREKLSQKRSLHVGLKKALEERK